MNTRSFVEPPGGLCRTFCCTERVGHDDCTEGKGIRFRSKRTTFGVASNFLEKDWWRPVHKRLIEASTRSSARWITIPRPSPFQSTLLSAPHHVCTDVGSTYSLLTLPRSDISSASSATTTTFETALAFNAIVFGIEIAAFTLLRPYFKAVYEPRTVTPVDECVTSC